MNVPETMNEVLDMSDDDGRRFVLLMKLNTQSVFLLMSGNLSFHSFHFMPSFVHEFFP